METPPYPTISNTMEPRGMYPRSRSITHTGGGYGVEITPRSEPRGMPIMYPRSSSISDGAGAKSAYPPVYNDRTFIPYEERNRRREFPLQAAPMTAGREAIAALKPPSRDTPVGKVRRMEAQEQPQQTSRTGGRNRRQSHNRINLPRPDRITEIIRRRSVEPVMNVDCPRRNRRRHQVPAGRRKLWSPGKQARNRWDEHHFRDVIRCSRRP